MYPIGLAKRDGRRNAAPGEFGQLERTTLESSPDADQRSVHEGDWVRVELHMVDQEAEVVLLRPVEWLALEGAAIGGQVGIHMSELGLSGPATVESIAAWAASAEATATAGGHPVTGLIRRTVPGYERLSLSSGEVLEVTGAHLVWSLDQGAWTEAAHLELGERLAGRAGPVTLVGRDLVPECTRVYNLEVQGTHTFRVGGNGVWVHNNCRSVSDPAPRGNGLPVQGPPNGTLVRDTGHGTGTIRDYDSQGRAQTDFDFHTGEAAGNPHAHDWTWSNGRPSRGAARPLKEGE